MRLLDRLIKTHTSWFTWMFTAWEAGGGACRGEASAASYWFKEGSAGSIPKEGKPQQHLTVPFALFIKNRPKHFMYHTKVSFAGGSHRKDWSRSAADPPPGNRVPGSSVWALGNAHKDCSLATASWGRGLFLEQRSPPHPMAKIRYLKVPL